MGFDAIDLEAQVNFKCRPLAHRMHGGRRFPLCLPYLLF